jgi:hypothetical protein
MLSWLSRSLLLQKGTGLTFSTARFWLFFEQRNNRKELRTRRKQNAAPQTKRRAAGKPQAKSKKSAASKEKRRAAGKQTERERRGPPRK